MDLNYLAIVVAAVAAFVVSSVWYLVWSGRLARLSPVYAEGGPTRAWTGAAELARNLAVAGVAAWLVHLAGVDTWGGAVRLAAALWAGFPLVILAGSVVHERVPPALAAIHVGDWLVKLLVVLVVVTLWQ